MTSIRARIRSRERLIGSFIKTPSHHSIEIAGSVGLDFVVIDGEHAPFGVDALDRCLLAARAAAIPALVRVPGVHSFMVQQALDLGADGLMVPHISSVEDARALVGAARFGGGVRGFSNSSRAGDYGRIGLADYVRHGDEETAIIAQIEDPAAVDAAAEIAAVDGIDLLFVGRADLAVVRGLPAVDHPRILSDVTHTVEAARSAGKACGIFLGGGGEVSQFAENGISLFVMGSDQSNMRAGWSAGLNMARSN